MNKLIRYILLFSLTIAATLHSYSQSGRTQTNFNRDWKFSLGDIAHAEGAVYNDQHWQSVSLPHSFSIPYFMSADFYTGYGWYRKHFQVSKPLLKQKQFFLEFEGAFQVAEVFVNGKKVGQHAGGYTGFSINITAALKPGDNIFAVRVNNLWNAQIAPRAGEHVFSGGIYRDVYLTAVDPVHIDWNGTFLKTPYVSADQATVALEAEIQNESRSAAQIEVATDLLNPKGRLVKRMKTSGLIPAGKSLLINQLSGRIGSPELWHPDHPFLYTALTKVYRSGQLVDTYKTKFGIRDIRWTADKGFFINGKHLYLLGANVHQDHAGWGDAVTNAGIYRDVKMIKDAGFNFIRGSHYPHDPAFAQACDELGILFWSENCFWGIGGSSDTPDGYWNTSAYPIKKEDNKPFEESLMQQLKEMIRINRNHPSIIAWSMSNEPFFTAAKTTDDMRNLLKKLVALSHQQDPTRSAGIGGAQRPLDSTRIDKIGDIAGYNGDGGNLAVFMNPGIPNVVTEYGSTTAERPGNYDPGWGDLAADSGKQKYAWRSGQAIWAAFDHGSIAGAHLGKMGIVDYFRIPKRAWYWYRNAYKHIPPPEWPKSGTPASLRLEADRKTSRTDGTEDVKLTVTVLDAQGKPLSNSPDVDLTVISGPGEFPTGRKIEFAEKSDIRIADGQAAIEYRSAYAGKSVVSASSPGLQSAEITIDFTGAVPFKSGITPIPAERPYIRFSRETQGNIPQKFGKNNPAFASSASQGHHAGFAVDGNHQTWWQAASNDPSPSWTLDTEKKLNISEIVIQFPEPGIYQYKVEVGETKGKFKTIADYSANTISETSKKIKLNQVTASYIRISFVNSANARIGDIEVTGTPLKQ